MKTDYKSLLKPEILNTVKGLELISRVIVDGHLAGLNRSSKVGAGMEFSQYRGYEPGDDIRLLDWKLLARTGRYYLKQSEIETNIAVKFILDASESMNYSEQKLSKADFARVLIASIAYLAQHQGDAIGLFGLNEQELYQLYPRVQKQHFNRFLHLLVEIKNKGKWPVKSTSTNVLHDRSHKELIFFITDMYQHENELIDFLKGLKTKRNEIVVINIIGKTEIGLNYKGSITFQDLETNEKIKVESNEIKQQYQASLNRNLESVKNKLFQKNISVEIFQMDQPIGELLNMFLRKRKMLF